MRKLFLILLLAIIMFANSFADVKIVSNEITKNGKKKVETVTYLTDTKFKVDINDKRKSTMMFDDAKKELINIDHKKKEYTVITQEDIEKLSKKIQEAMAQLDEQLKAMPEKQRNFMKKMMGGEDNEKIVVSYEYKKTNQTKQINGYSCTKFDGFLNGELVSELWVTDYSNFKVNKSDFEVLQRFAEFAESMTKKFVSTNANLNSFKNDLPGVAIKTSTLDDGKIDYETEVVSIEKTTLSESDFEIPSKYKKIEIKFE